MADDKARTERIQRVYRADGYDNLVQEYNDWAGEYDADLKVLGFIGPRAAADMLAKYVTDLDVKILDAGSGTGMVGDELARHGFKRITALDMSPGMLMTANEKLVYEQLVVAELGKPLDFESDSFDVVTCVGTFTYNHAPPESLDELVRITKPGGKIVFTVRTDFRTESGFDVKQTALEEANLWKLIERTEPFQGLPDGEPDIWYEVWAYEVL